MQIQENWLEEVKQTIRIVPDFPKPGILFKDITPLLKRADLCLKVVDEMALRAKMSKVEAVIGIESRGFLFGFLLSTKLGVPFIPVRKAGKLPFTTHQVAYNLEYGQAVVEMNTDALSKGMKVLVHDDLLATGGTAAAAAQLVEMQGAEVVAFSFLVELGFLDGAKFLDKYEAEIQSILTY